MRLCNLVNNALECYDAQLKPWTSIVSSLLLYFKRLRKRYNVQTECRDRDTRFRFQNPLDIWYYFHTSTESALHVESPWVVYEVFRPGFFRPVVQLANMFANDKIVALASDVLAAYDLTSCWRINGNCLKSVSLKEHATNSIFSSTSFVGCLNMDNPWDQKIGW